MPADPRKATTLAIFDRDWHCRQYVDVLKLHCIRVKMVAKYALQVHPDDVEQAKGLLAREQAQRDLMEWPPTPEWEEFKRRRREGKAAGEAA